MSDFEVYILLLILSIPAIGIYWLAARILSRFRKPRYVVADRLHARLARPDFAAVEAHFGVKLPEELKVFHRSPLEREVTIRLESGEWDINHMEPLDGESPGEAWPGCERYVAIANDGGGNQYLFDPKNLERGVFFHDHETGGMSPVIHSVAEFLAAVRKADDWRG